MNAGVPVSFSVMAFWGYSPSSGIARSYGSFIPSFLRNPHPILHSGYISLHSHQQYKRIPFYSHTLQHLSFVKIVWWWPTTVFWFRQWSLDQCGVIPHCSFNWHFSNNKWCWASFYVLVGYLYVFFGEMSVGILLLMFHYILKGLWGDLVTVISKCICYWNILWNSVLGSFRRGAYNPYLILWAHEGNSRGMDASPVWMVSPWLSWLGKKLLLVVTQLCFVTWCAI